MESTVSGEAKTESKPVAEFPLTVQAANHLASPPRRVSDPHWFNADPDLAFFIIADPGFFSEFINNFLREFFMKLFSLTLIPVILRACKK
jgi:hypothetical protein